MFEIISQFAITNRHLHSDADDQRLPTTNNNNTILATTAACRRIVPRFRCLLLLLPTTSVIPIPNPMAHLELSMPTIDVDETYQETSSGKKRRVTKVRAASIHFGSPSPSLVTCSKGRMPRGCIPIEYVLHLPSRLTKSAYQTLLACDAVPRQWHLEGRAGSRTHTVSQSVRGIPILHHDLQSTPQLIDLLETEGVSIVEKEFVHNHRTTQNAPEIDARMHPELEPPDFINQYTVPNSLDGNYPKKKSAFIYAEMFGGLGGFGVALERLGGKCVFYSELEERCRETYALNFDTPLSCIHGDIYNVPDEAFPKHLDLLVAGFPCQPFSSLGEQPGFDCNQGRGQLYLQIVRFLELSKPKSFLLENVPGLLTMKDTLHIIVSAFRGVGYKVTAEICSARGLTATSRKRLFFVGIRNDLIGSKFASNGDPSTESNSQSFSPLGGSSSYFQFPFIPDLKLCSHDILDYDTLPSTELDVLRLSSSTWTQLLHNKRWKPHQLAWPNRHCDTLTSHYGNAVGRGDSQLVPSCAPHPPRRFSVRECARIMGFPNTFQFCDIRLDQGEIAYRKELYRMIGNAVCPPLVAVLAGTVLAKVMSDTHNWIALGHQGAMDLACSALRSSPVPLPPGCLVYNGDCKDRREDSFVV